MKQAIKYKVTVGGRKKEEVSYLVPLSDKQIDNECARIKEKYGYKRWTVKMARYGRGSSLPIRGI